METFRFYNELADVYHLIYADWEQSIAQQASALDSIIRQHLGAGIESVLDASCGIGTQSLGLAQRGYAVTGSELQHYVGCSRKLASQMLSVLMIVPFNQY